MSRLLGCDIAKLPIKYLGIPLCAKPKRNEMWKPILDKIERKLSMWKIKFLSKVSRLVLIKSVFNSTRLYYLGLFKMSKVVAKKVMAPQCRFFMLLVKWSLIQELKEKGGLGIGDLVVKNSALLFE